MLTEKIHGLIFTLLNLIKSEIYRFTQIVGNTLCLATPSDKDLKKNLHLPIKLLGKRQNPFQPTYFYYIHQLGSYFIETGFL
jgi:hypothetical protein